MASRKNAIYTRTNLNVTKQVKVDAWGWITAWRVAIGTSRFGEWHRATYRSLLRIGLPGRVEDMDVSWRKINAT